MATYELELSKTDFLNMSKKINQLSQKLIQSKNLILKGLAEYTKERIQYYINDTVGKTGYIPTNELLDSIMISDIVGNTIRVFTDCAYAKFVEYGTGVIGSSNPHPKSAEINWQYDKNAHGEKGWVYTIDNGSGEKQRFWTKGLEPHAFMYNACRDLQQNYLTVARKILVEGGLLD